MRERLGAAVAITLLTVVLATSYWYSQSLRNGPAAPGGRGSIDFLAEGIAMTQFDALGRPRYRLYAAHLQHYPDSDDVDFSEPRLVSLRADRPQVRASARHAHAVNNGERVELAGEVELSRAGAGGWPPLRVRTEALTALPDLDRYETSQPVLVERGPTTIRAHGMLLDNLARRVELRGAVRETIAPPAGRAGRPAP